jgi:hypothetical protein
MPSPSSAVPRTSYQIINAAPPAPCAPRPPPPPRSCWRWARSSSSRATCTRTTRRWSRCARWVAGSCVATHASMATQQGQGAFKAAGLGAGGWGRRGALWLHGVSVLARLHRIAPVHCGGTLWWRSQWRLRPLTLPASPRPHPSPPCWCSGAHEQGGEQVQGAQRGGESQGGVCASMLRSCTSLSLLGHTFGSTLVTPGSQRCVPPWSLAPRPHTCHTSRTNRTTHSTHPHHTTHHTQIWEEMKAGTPVGLANAMRFKLDMTVRGGERLHPALL